MGRELKRKQAKREGKNVREVQKQNKEKELSPKTFTILLVVLVFTFIILYLVTGIFITKDIKWFSKDKDNEVVSIENKILAKEALRQAEESYYVYFYDTTNEDSTVGNLVSAQNEKVYRVDLHDDFNSNFVGEPSGIVDSIDNLKVKDMTLIKVSSEKIVEYYSGSDEITIALDR